MREKEKRRETSWKRTSERVVESRGDEKVAAGVAKARFGDVKDMLGAAEGVGVSSALVQGG